MHGVKKSIALMAGLLLSVAGILMAPGSAMAQPSSSQALPTCNGGTWTQIGPFDGVNRWTFIPVYNNSASCHLQEGNYNNWGVVALQNILIKCYNQNIARDGDFGEDTFDALWNAQLWEREHYQETISVDGEYGPETFGAVLLPTYASSGNLDASVRCADPTNN